MLRVKVKWSRYRPGVTQRVGRGIALLFHDRGTRRAWVVSSTPPPHFTPEKDPVPILQEVGWAPGPVWTGGKSRPHRDSIPDRPARSQSLYRLSYPAHRRVCYNHKATKARDPYLLFTAGRRYAGLLCMLLWFTDLRQLAGCYVMRNESNYFS